ncbi:nucleoporin FG repeat region-domain-containing protein [Scheffersomyces coipomensis]|uniref:nucleoporin FG repeat region-domain-containing protein n=1 Tax=Scheffersomyces coipomensis TaxID=1788519 RepID=UPI00315D5F39
MFGQANTSASTPSFGFGANNNTTNSASGGLFGSKPAAPTSGTGVAGISGSGGLFGNSNSVPAPGGLFGSATSNTTNSNTTGGTGLFGSASTTNTSSTNTAGGLFGGASNNTATGPTSGGLFGNKPATSAPSGGLFGSSNTNPTASNTTTSGGLFGNTVNTGTTGGLFGGKPAGTTSTGLFGSNTNTAAPSGGLFGGSNTGNTNTTGGLFGGNTSNTTTGGGLFGSSNTGTTTGGLFGSSQPQQQQQIQQQQQQPQLTAMTRVGDLPPNIKQQLEQFDKYINTQHLISTSLQSDYSKHDDLINSIPKDINYLHNKIVSTKQALKFDTNQLAFLKELNNELTDDISKIMQLILQLSTPGTKLSSSFQLNEFFIKKIKKYHEILNQYEILANELNQILSGLERSCIEGFGNLFNIVQVIKSQYGLFMELCEIMAQLHNETNKLSKK